MSIGTERASRQVEAGPAGERPGSPLASGPPRQPSARALSEATMVARAQDGDAEAFEQLMITYQAELFRLAYRMLRDRGDAEDVVQDTFVMVWRKLPTLLEPNAFRGWIYQIATRSCLQVGRIRTRRRTDLTDGTDQQLDAQSQAAHGHRGDGPAASMQAAAQREELDVALAELPPEQRLCWVLKNLQGLSYQEIAVIAGTPVSTVRGRIARARKTLAERMAPWR